MWEKATEIVLQRDNLPESAFLEVGLEAWELIGLCAKGLPNSNATLAFWLSWNDGNRKRREIAEFLNRELNNENITVDNVRDYLNNARSNIRKCLKEEYGIDIKP